MQGRKMRRKIHPFISFVAVIVTAAALVATIYITRSLEQWQIFLAGILVAALFAETNRVSRAIWSSRRRTRQLALLRGKLEQETQLRKRAEDAFSASRPRLRLLDEVLPIRVAFIDADGRCRYGNRAFMEWLRLRPEQTTGRHLRDMLGDPMYQSIAEQIRLSLAGQAAHYERTQKMPDGVQYHLAIDQLPQGDEDGKVSGFYMLIHDLPLRAEVPVPAPVATAPAVIAAPAVPAIPAVPAAEVRVQPEEVPAPETFIDPFSRQAAVPEDAGGLIMAAIEKDEFYLFCQEISPLTPEAGTVHYEILVRLKEEEESLMPPGAFFPLAEKYGLMPHLDRWVVEHVVEWASYHRMPPGEGPIYFINLSDATIGDSAFPEFLQQTLREHGVHGSTLCFEIPNAELALRGAVMAEFAQRIKQNGCRVAVSGFGYGRILFEQVRGLQVDFLKIDGSIILDILRDPVDLSKVTSIQRAAKIMGIKTVAELVESEETITKLKEIGIDYAQGFAISHPHPLED
ncbi:MAG TPA: EAL domain-containing protein [Gallionella sp.]|nr:EAL domain-containing protein [Gallionella sp.]